jgi:inner membrane protein
MPGNEIAQLAATNCEAAAFMRFARVPWAMQRDDRWLVGDLRYDREPGLGFAELELPEGSARCPRHVPPWIPPRAEIM